MVPVRSRSVRCGDDRGRVESRSSLSSGGKIEFLARAIVNRLEDRGLVEFGDAETAILVVTKTLSDNNQAYELIEQEARLRLGTAEPSDDELEQAMQRIAAERNFVL